MITDIEKLSPGKTEADRHKLCFNQKIRAIRKGKSPAQEILSERKGEGATKKGTIRQKKARSGGDGITEKRRRRQMSKDEAISQLERLKALIEYGYSQNYQTAIDIAIEAIREQIRQEDDGK